MWAFLILYRARVAPSLRVHSPRVHHTHTHTHIHTHTCLHAHTCTHIHMHHTHTMSCTYIHVHTYMHTHVHTHTMSCTHMYTHTHTNRVFLIPKYIAGVAPIDPSEGDPLPNAVVKQNDLSKFIESKITAGLDRFKTDLSKEMLGMMQASGLLKSKM